MRKSRCLLLKQIVSEVVLLNLLFLLFFFKFSDEKCSLCCIEKYRTRTIGILKGRKMHCIKMNVFMVLVTLYFSPC